MNQRGSGVTEDSSAKYAKEHQKFFGFAERRPTTLPPGAFASPAANTSGIIFGFIAEIGGLEKN
jgi:hypothetical protein